MATHPFDLTKWQHWVATGFGSGLSPKAPGTVGTLAALPLVYGFSLLPPVWSLLLIVAICWLGVVVSQQVSRDIGVDDHGGIVIDEVAGFALAMWALPFTLSTVLFAFLLFRFFDIVKPGPVGWCDRQLTGGIGIMADDIVAGLLACGILHSVLFAIRI